MSPLVVEDDAAFRSSVLTALKQICPCFELSIDTNGEVHAADAVTSCSCYLAHTASCNLIRGLIDHDGTTSIRESAPGGGNQYDYQVDEAWWNPALPTPDGLTSSLTLAHELIHAWRDRLGKLALYDFNLEECTATWGENQVREEMGEPERQDYDTYYCFWSVLDPSDAPPLDDSDLEGCGISESILDKILGVVGEAVRIIRDVYRLVNSKWWEILKPKRGPVFRRQVPDETDFDQDAADFADLVQEGPPELSSRFDAALHTRFNSAQRPYVVGLTPDPAVDPSRWVLVEGVDLDGWYRVIFIQRGPDRVVLVTNLRLSGDPELFVGPPGPLVEYHLTDPASAEAVESLMSAAEFSDGVGGNTGVFDGMVQFCKLGSAGSLSRTALFGYGYPGFIRNPVPPRGADAPRWAVIARTYELWRDLMATGPMPVREIAPA